MAPERDASGHGGEHLRGRSLRGSEVSVRGREARVSNEVDGLSAAGVTCPTSPTARFRRRGSRAGYLLFAQMARDIADRLETPSLVKRRVHAQIDIDGARECDEMARELRSLTSDFSKWPELS